MGRHNEDDEKSARVSGCVYVCQHEYFRDRHRVVVTEHHQNEDILLSRAEGEREEGGGWSQEKNGKKQ